jgi:hypothetical protein
MAKFDKSEIKVIAERVEEDPAISELVTLMEREADAELLGGTITLRWGRQQIDVVKRAAAIFGVPYQTYLKQVVFKQALEDIARAEAVLEPSEMSGIAGRAQPPTRGKRKAAASR